MSDSLWRPAARPPALGPRDVHVWHVDLDAGVPAALALAPRLPAEERTRAERYRFARDRERFLAGRVALRGVLAAYLGGAPEGVALRQSPFGKPVLQGDHGIEFNLAHSEGCALLAVARRRRIGVDVEALRLGQSGMDVARRFFAPAEVARLSATPAEARALTFVRCWTRKEAYVKARGEGLSLPLQQFQVPLAPDATRALMASVDGPDEVARWSLRELVPAPGFLGALVVEGPIGTVTLLEWAGDAPAPPPLDSLAAASYADRTIMMPSPDRSPRRPTP
jgi:4'-phosphopantetheinyl transferase